MMGSFQAMLLLAIQLLGDDACAQEIVRVLSKYTTEPSVQQVCAALKRLRENGLVQADSFVKKRTRVRASAIYVCTKEGRKTLVNHLTVLDSLREACSTKGVNLNLE